MKNNTSELVVQNTNAASIQYSEKKIQTIKDTICKGASDADLELFIQACKQTGLNPFVGQIYSMSVKGTRTIHIGIDGWRLIADRTGNYFPGETEFFYDKEGKLHSAKVSVKRRTQDGSWGVVSAVAFLSEYSTGRDNWLTKQHIMLGKCAEMLALRKAFPLALSSVPIQQEEIPQEDRINNTPVEQPREVEVSSKITKEQSEKIEELLAQFVDCEQKTETLLKYLKVEELKDISEDRFETLVAQLESQLSTKG